MRVIDSTTSVPKYVRDAEAIARRAHAGQYRWDDITPYIVHPERVARSFPNGEWAAIATGWLHDVIEDTGVTKEDLIVHGIPDVVIDAVVLLTKPWVPDGAPKPAYLDYINAIAANPLARSVKVMDIIDNLSDSASPKQVRKYAGTLKILIR